MKRFTTGCELQMDHLNQAQISVFKTQWAEEMSLLYVPNAANDSFTKMLLKVKYVWDFAVIVYMICNCIYDLYIWSVIVYMICNYILNNNNLTWHWPCWRIGNKQNNATTRVSVVFFNPKQYGISEFTDAERCTFAWIPFKVTGSWYLRVGGALDSLSLIVSPA